MRFCVSLIFTQLFLPLSFQFSVFSFWIFLFVHIPSYSSSFFSLPPSSKKSLPLLRSCIFAFLPHSLTTFLVSHSLSFSLSRILFSITLSLSDAHLFPHPTAARSFSPSSIPSRSPSSYSFCSLSSFARRELYAPHPSNRSHIHPVCHHPFPCLALSQTASFQASHASSMSGFFRR